MVKNCNVLHFVRNASLSLSLLSTLLIAAICLSPSASAMQSQNPIQAMKDAWKKAKEEQQQKTQQPQQQKPGQPKADGAKPTNSVPGGKSLPHSSAKVDAQLMAATEAGLQFGVSEPGGHIAARAHSGSREVILYDGVSGPKFDAIVDPTTGSGGFVVFSPDGNHYAYSGRLGNEIVLMVDGKEVLKYDDSKFSLEPGVFSGTTPTFTPNSKHYLFLLRPKSTMGYESQQARLFWDGVPGPIYAETATISPDGDHYAYFTRQPTPNAPIVNLFLDGKPAGYLAGKPQFSFDGKHLFTEVDYSRPTPYQEILLDGKPIMKTNGVQLYMPPAGYNFLAVLGTGISGSARFLVYAGKKIVGSDCTGTGGYDQITFTPDGKHWAARCDSRPGFHFVIADGKKGQEYQMISMLHFTADGTVTYFATQRNLNFVVIGDQESEAYDNMLLPAQNVPLPATAGPTVIGNHIAYVSRKAAASEASLNVDGKVFKAYDAGKLQFTPDGQHFAFVSMPAPSATGAGILVLDGVSQPGTYQDMAQLIRDNQAHVPTFVFSPDSKHVAWYGRSPSDPTGSGIFVDGKYIRASEPGISVWHLSFTPDSKHVVYAAILRTEQPGVTDYGVFVDGRLAVQIDQNMNLMLSDSSWQFGDDGALNVWGQDADGIKRFHITPADDTSVATITGGASLMAKNN